MNLIRHRTRIAIIAAGAMIAVVPVHGDEHKSGDRQPAADTAILPLERILARVREAHDGRILEVELEKEGGMFVYEIELVDENGTVRELYYDAASGVQLEIRDDD